MALSILIIDDEFDIGESYKKLLSDRGMDVRFAVNPEDGLNMMKYAPDIVLLDYKMKPMNGLDVLKIIKQDNPDQIVIMMTAYGNVENAVEAMKLGAFHYIQKPFTIDELCAVLENAAEIIEMRRKIELSDRSLKIGDLGYLDGKSPAMKAVYKRAQKVSETPNTAVLILGESGTGKEMLAKTIHELSDRASYPFVAINCSAIPDTLLESELFGYEPGAFTGATKRKRGLLEVADKGTLFLDEISDMPLSLQAKLLRVLENLGFNRLGNPNETIQVDIRVIAASNKNLDELVANNLFREDLYYRLSRFTIYMPPLRERDDDVIDLALKFIKHFNAELKRNIKGLDNQAVKAIKSFSWPGNVRQLKNAIESAMIECESDYIRVSDLPSIVKHGSTQKAERIAEDFIKSGMPPLEEVKNNYILKVLGQCETDQEAANILGISRRTITRLKKELKTKSEGQNVT